MKNQGIFSKFADEYKKYPSFLMNIFKSIYIRQALFLIACLFFVLSLSIASYAKSAKEFVVVIDAGHGGKDHGAIDNNSREKDINLEVALRLGELIDKKIKDAKVVYTRDNDSFVSLQGRADIANKSKADLFISIHTNSVDTKNKNRTSIAGASVYTLGPHKDDANMDIARRENSVIELENGYDQKYSGFDPNKDESYIIFEMAQKQNLAMSNRFAKMVQDNLVKIADRKDRGVHQAGFWVLWSTSMPSVLVELDFICNPESAKFMTSKEGVNKLADALFQAVKVYEMNFRQAQRMAKNQKKDENDSKNGKALVAQNRDKKEKKSTLSVTTDDAETLEDSNITVSQEMFKETYPVGLSFHPQEDERDLSHSRVSEIQNQKRAKYASDGRKRRSASARQVSMARNVEGEIRLRSEFTGTLVAAQQTPQQEKPAAQTSEKQKKKKKKSSKKVSTKILADNKKPSVTKHASVKSPKNLKENKSDINKNSDKEEKQRIKAERASQRQLEAMRKKTEKEKLKQEKNKRSGEEISKNETTTSHSTSIKNENESDLDHAAKRKSLRSRTNSN